MVVAEFPLATRIGRLERRGGLGVVRYGAPEDAVLHTLDRRGRQIKLHIDVEDSFTAARALRARPESATRGLESVPLDSG
jgi:hypothetical protein